MIASVRSTDRHSLNGAVVGVETTATGASVGVESTATGASVGGNRAGAKMVGTGTVVGSGTGAVIGAGLGAVVSSGGATGAVDSVGTGTGAVVGAGMGAVGSNGGATGAADSVGGIAVGFDGGVIGDEGPVGMDMDIDMLMSRCNKRSHSSIKSEYLLSLFFFAERSLDFRGESSRKNDFLKTADSTSRTCLR